MTLTNSRLRQCVFMHVVNDFISRNWFAFLDAGTKNRPSEERITLLEIHPSACSMVAYSIFFSLLLFVPSFEIINSSVAFVWQYSVLVTVLVTLHFRANYLRANVADRKWYERCEFSY